METNGKSIWLLNKILIIYMFIKKNMQHKQLRNCVQKHGYLFHILDLISPNVLQSLHVSKQTDLKQESLAQWMLTC